MGSKSFNEVIPEVTYLICLELSLPLGVCDKFRPESLVNSHHIGIVRKDEVMLTVTIDIPKIVGKQVVFSRCKKQATTLDEAFLFGQIRDKIRNRIQRTHDDF